MKTLFILRHAKSSWGSADLADFERALNPQGREEAVFMGDLIRERQIQFDVILSSPAKRAKQTALTVKAAALIDKDIRYEENIYEASHPALLEIVSGIADRNQTALLVGHNPGLEALIKFLTGEAQAMPTAGLAKITLQIDSWSQVAANCARLESFAFPEPGQITRLPADFGFEFQIKS